MKVKEEDILLVLEKLEPKIKSSLLQTDVINREDLSQDLKEMIIKKLNDGTIESEVPGLFEYLKRKNNP